MEFFDLFLIAKRNKRVIAWSLLVFLLVAIGATFLQPMEYRTRSRVLIIANNKASDPFQAAKNSEYLTGVLKEVISSNAFFDEVSAAGFNIDQSYYSRDLRIQTRQWQKSVSAKAINDYGVLEVDVYHQNRYQADQVAQAVNYTLKNRSNLFLSAGEKVDVRIIDQPVTTTWPVRPNLFLNFGLAIVLGLGFGLFAGYLKEMGNKSSVPVIITPIEPMPNVANTTETQEVIMENQTPAAPAFAFQVNTPQYVPVASAKTEADRAAADRQAYAERVSGFVSNSAVLTPVTEPVGIDESVESPDLPPSYFKENQVGYNDIINQGDIRNLF